MTTWNIKNLAAKIEAQHGRIVEEHFQSAIQSFAWKHFIAAFHKEEAERIFRKALTAIPNQDGLHGDPWSIMHAIFASSSQQVDGVPFELSKVQVEANAIAAAQAVHSMGDILANACYWAMRLDLLRPEVALEKLTLRCIRKCSHSSANFTHLCKPISDLFDLEEWKYLNAFVNRSKHVSLVFGFLQASFDEGKGGIRLKSFDYKGCNFSEKWIDDFLDELNIVYRSLCAIGLGLNRIYLT